MPLESVQPQEGQLMKTYIFAGKGGVGKTNSTVALGLHLASTGMKTCIVDYDGGHSVAWALGREAILPGRTTRVAQNLSVAVIEEHEFQAIAECKKNGTSLETYLTQFPDDLGIIPLADMVNAFFGVPTDVAALSRLAQLVRILSEAEEKYDAMLIDVEPTAGLAHMLSNIEATARSLVNLNNQGIVKLAVLGATWPDIAGYLKSKYIRNAEKYAGRLAQSAKILKGARYNIVATPEEGPIKQTEDVARIIMRFGGKVHAQSPLPVLE